MTNPWKGISPGKSKLISEKILNHDFYWYVEDRNNNPCLLFKIKNQNTPLPQRNKLPPISYIKFHMITQDYRYLCVELMDKTYIDLFGEFCNLLTKTSLEIEDESTALNVFIKKAWRWQSLLSKTKEKKLSEEKQKGLLGELYFLENFLFPIFNKKISVQNWFGPTGASKDFEFSKFQVEIKSKRSGSEPTIKISSSNQLEILKDSRLFLCIFGIDKSESEESSNLHDWCEKISEQIFNSDFTEILNDFNEKLNKVGYHEEQDYSEDNWDIKEITYYEVKKEFPKLVSSEIPPAIANVNYSIYMNQLKPFQIEKEDLIDFLNDSNS